MPLRPHQIRALLFGSIIVCLFLPTPSPIRAVQQLGTTPRLGDSNTADSLTLTVTVTDRDGHYISGLTKENFVVLIGKTPQEIVAFDTQSDPISVGLVLDLSGSMYDVYRAFGKGQQSPMYTAIARFLRASHPDDEYFMSGFNKNSLALVEPTTDAGALMSVLPQISSRITKGQTALYDACYDAVQKAAAGKHAKRVVILFTDGEDNQSRRTKTEVLHLLKERGVLLYAVGFVDKKVISELAYAGQAVLDELTAATGGKSYFVEQQSKLADVFERIAVELRNQYTIQIRPAGLRPADRDQRIKIKVSLPATFKKSLTARNCPSFYSRPTQP